MYAASNNVIAIKTLINLSMKVPSGKNIGNITADINKTVIKGTPLQNSIKPMDTYLIEENWDLRPRANIIPTGKQKIKQKKDIINVKDKPPQAPVSTQSRPKAPPEIKKYIKINAIIG